MQSEVIHPNWPTVWPRMQTDGKILVQLNSSKTNLLTFYSIVLCLTMNNRNSTNTLSTPKTSITTPSKDPKQDRISYKLYSMRPLTKKNKQFLWECEEERFVYKACLRHLISLKRTDKHTSWDTAEISNLNLT